MLNLFEDSTFGVIKCYKNVFDITNKKDNIGFWVFSVIIICHIPLYIMFFLKGISPIKEFIINEMKKYHYYIDLGTPPKKKIKKISLKKYPNQNMKTINNEMTEGTDKRINVMTPKNIKNFKKIIYFKYKSYILGLITLALPILAGSIGHTIIGITDILVVARYNINSLAAISIANAILFTLFIFGLGVQDAICIILSNKRGANEEIKKYFNTVLLFSLILGLIFTTACYSTSYLIEIGRAHV